MGQTITENPGQIIFQAVAGDKRKSESDTDEIFRKEHFLS